MNNNNPFGDDEFADFEVASAIPVADARDKTIPVLPKKMQSPNPSNFIFDFINDFTT